MARRAPATAGGNRARRVHSRVAVPCLLSIRNHLQRGRSGTATRRSSHSFVTLTGWAVCRCTPHSITLARRNKVGGCTAASAAAASPPPPTPTWARYVPPRTDTGQPWRPPGSLRKLWCAANASRASGKDVAQSLQRSWGKTTEWLPERLEPRGCRAHRRQKTGVRGNRTLTA